MIAHHHKGAAGGGRSFEPAFAATCAVGPMCVSLPEQQGTPAYPMMPAKVHRPVGVIDGA